MKAVSNLFKTLWEDRAHKVELKVEIGNTVINNGDIIEYKSEHRLFAEDNVSVGGCLSGEYSLILDVSSSVVVPKMANIKVYLRLTKGNQASEWIPQGDWFVDTRERTDDGYLKLNGFDAMLKAEQKFYDTESSDTYPCTDTVALQRIATKLGLQIDSRTTSIMNKSYSISHPSIGQAGYTIRDVLGYIAALYGGNFIITDEGKLRLVSLASLPTTSTTPDYDVGNNLVDISTADDLDAFSRVTIEVGVNDNGTVLYYTAGNDTGTELYLVSPYGTQQAANNLLSAISGKVYKPYEAEQADVIPANELGDIIKIGGINYAEYYRYADYDADYSADISAPFDEEINSEYTYSASNSVDRKIYSTRAQLIVRIDSIEASVEGKTTTYYQNTIPLSATSGDLWFTTGTVGSYQQGKWYRYNGSSWNVLTDSEIAALGLRVDDVEGDVQTITTWKSSFTMTPQTIESKVTSTETAVGDLEVEVNDHESRITQNAADITAKVSSTGSNGQNTFSWSLISTAFELKANGQTVFKCDQNGVVVNGYMAVGGNISDLYNDADFQDSNGVEGIITNKVTANYVNALNITAKKVEVKKTVRGTAQTVFLADATTNTVTIGGWTVGAVTSPNVFYHPAFDGGKAFYLCGEADWDTNNDAPIGAQSNLAIRIGEQYNANFAVGYNGNLYAANAYLSGQINASGGSIGDLTIGVVPGYVGAEGLYYGTKGEVYSDSYVSLCDRGVEVGGYKSYAIIENGDSLFVNFLCHSPYGEAPAEVCKFRMSYQSGGELNGLWSYNGTDFNDLVVPAFSSTQNGKVLGVVSGSLAWVNQSGGGGGGTVTSVSVKMNGTVKGTVTSSGIIDLGTVITSHQSLAGYATQTWVRNQGYTSNTGTVTSVSVKMNGYNKGTVTTSGTINLGTGWATQSWCWDNFIPYCLVEGTKIKMFDGTEKNIEDVVIGDSIISYDPLTGENVEAVVIGNICTGKAKKYTTLMFDDGSHIEAYGEHSFWRESSKSIVNFENWTEGDKGRNVDLEQISLVWKESVNYAMRKKHYVLYSSNNLYYANGILTGHWSSTKVNYVIDHNDDLEFPQSLIDAYTTEANANDTRNEMFIQPEFIERGKTVLSELHSLNRQVDEKKKRLEDTDYTYVKGFERFINALKTSISKYKVITLSAIKEAVDGLEDFDPTDRESWRKFVEDTEPVIATKQSQYLALRKEILTDKGVLTPAQIFRNSCHRANNDVEIVKEWAKKRKSQLTEK